ncbi:MAG: Cof-type HAD-IIB family hydrolase [Ruminococcaceae bacterium]|nr:Cof-type HAD-IIB family hydrolase [Oscillospiraceae bacterium]
MQKYKIVASDLDGTLFNNSSQISEENMRAIAELAKRDVCFVPSTGRGFSELPEELKNNPNIRYLICSNGAVVFDKKTSNSIKACISQELSNQVLGLLNSYETHLSIRHNGGLFVDSGIYTDEQFTYYNFPLVHSKVLREYGQFIDDFKNVIYSFDDIEVISAFFKSNDDRMECKKVLEKNKSLIVVEGCDYNLEIFSASAGKGSALHALADMLGVDYADTISIGDSDNDTSSIKAAGLGLAVSNACDSLKEIADEVICSNDEHAVEYVLNNYIK